MKILLIDNYDSFTYMLKDYIEQCGVFCNVIRNDDVNLTDEISQHDAIVISPGPQTPNDAGQLMDVLHKIALVKPILGICLGHQAIGLYAGAQLQKALVPKHGKIDLIHHTNHKLFHNIPVSFLVTRYHSLVLQNIPSQLSIIAKTSNNEIMGIAHNSLPLYGIQFHPESCTTEFGLIIIKNFLALAHQNR